MKWHEALVQWLVKTALALSCVVLGTAGIQYFIGGGKLVDGTTIPISGLISCLLIPLGFIALIPVFGFIVWTEKEIENELP